jgi:hypothetical protein
MKFNKIGVGILSLSMLFCGAVFGADSNIKIVDTQTNKTFNRDVLFYNGYVKSTGDASHFSGSTTTNGGTSTFSAGTVYVGDLINSKDFAISVVPAATGSCTVKIWGVFGTTTVSTGTNTVGPVLLSTTTYDNISAGTSTLVSITSYPELVAVGINVSAGTMTVNCGMNSMTER